MLLLFTLIRAMVMLEGTWINSLSQKPQTGLWDCLLLCLFKTVKDDVGSPFEKARMQMLCFTSNLCAQSSY